MVKVSKALATILLVLFLFAVFAGFVKSCEYTSTLPFEHQLVTGVYLALGAAVSLIIPGVAIAGIWGEKVVFSWK